MNTRFAGEYPQLSDYIRERYQAGDHVVDGGNGIGLFWASEINDAVPLERKPASHGLSLVFKALDSRRPIHL